MFCTILLSIVYVLSDKTQSYRALLLNYSNFYFYFIFFTGKSPFFQTLEDQTGLLDDPGSHLIDTSVQALASPSRSSPHSQGSESSERFSRKVFVGGLPPDIDEGNN